MSRWTLQVVSVLAAAVGVLASGCAEKAVEKSFVDEHGRVCTYVMVEESDGDKDVGNLSCEYPRSPAPSTPIPSSPRG